MNQQSKTSIFVSALVAALVSSALVLYMNSIDTETEASSSSVDQVYERVMATGKLRCGYVIYPPSSIKDPNTGELSGIFVDAIELAAENIGIEVEWAEEVGWGSMIEGLLTDRYDMICSAVWANSTRAKLADFTAPLFFSGIGAYVRSEDDRFDNDLAAIDDPSIRISTVDGEMSAIIAAADFPNASTVSLTQLSDVSQMLLNITEGKADVTFVEPYIANQFQATNPGSLKNITPRNPVRIFPNTMMVRKGESSLTNMVNVALSEVINSGQMDKLVLEYAGTPNPYYPVASPYRSGSVD